jgi:P-type E1-E2 ATPase
VAGALDALRRLGVRHMLLLTGDRREVAASVAKTFGLDFEAEVPLDQKLRVIERLQGEGRTVAMIGDGINDAPALAQADVGIAMGVARTDAAIEAAHVALMRDDWRMVPEAIRLSRRAFGTIKHWCQPPPAWPRPDEPSPRPRNTPSATHRPPQSSGTVDCTVPSSNPVGATTGPRFCD